MGAQGEGRVVTTPLVLPCGAVLANRLAKAAMSEQLADRVNAPSARLVRLYERWADSGCGLLVTGNLMVDRRAISEPRQVVVDDDTDRRGLERLAAAGKRGGAHLWAQLNHGGSQVPRFLARRSVAPSPVRVDALGAFGTPRALTGTEIEAIIERYAVAASIAIAAGFDGVQIHAAHGYLLSQFLSPHANRRDDGWGGDLTGRMRALVGVVRAVRSAVGPSVPIGVKLNSSDFRRGGFDEPDALRVVVALEAEGVDLVEISGGTFEVGAMMGAGPHGASTRRATSAGSPSSPDARPRSRSCSPVASAPARRSTTRSTRAPSTSSASPGPWSPTRPSPGACSLARTRASGCPPGGSEVGGSTPSPRSRGTPASSGGSPTGGMPTSTPAPAPRWRRTSPRRSARR